MDFHQNTQPEVQGEQNSGLSPDVPASAQVTNQNTVSSGEVIPNQEIASAQQQSGPNPPAGNAQNRDSTQNQASYDNTNGNPCQIPQPYGSNNGNPYQNRQPYDNSNGNPYQNRRPYDNSNGNPYQNRQPYDNSNGNPYQNRQPYDNSNGNPYQNRPPYPNGNPYSGNNQYQNNAPYGNGAPYYNRNTYQVPIAEPGSGLANASMILGIISIITSFTFTVYPAFVLGSIAVILALLSKGRRPKLLSKARTGMICAIIGLITNTVLVTACAVLLFTNPDVRSEVNETFEKQYGVSFDEMMDEIMEEGGFSY